VAGTTTNAFISSVCCRMAKPDPFLDELSCLTSVPEFTLDRLESCLIKALDSFQGGTKKRQSTVAQILSENIQIMFSRVLARLSPEVVCKSLGFTVAFACGLVDDQIDFALGESFLRFVDNQVFDNSYLSHLVPMEAYAAFVRVLVLALKRPDCKYPQKSLLPWIRKAISNSNWDIDTSIVKSLLESCINMLRSSPNFTSTTKGEVFHIVSELFTRAPVLLAESEAPQVNGDRVEVISFLVDEATACIEDKSLCESACHLLRAMISMESLTASATRALSTTLLSILESNDSIIPRDQRLRSNSSFQISLLFVDLINAPVNFSTSQPRHLDRGHSPILSSLFSSKAGIENGCAVLAFSLSKDPSLINLLDLEHVVPFISSTLEKVHKVAEIVFICLSAVSLSFTHCFNGPKRQHASLWDNLCSSLLKFCNHRTSELGTFHGLSAALKSLLPLCSGQSSYAQLESFLLVEHGSNPLELFAQFCSFAPCSKVLKERAIAAAGKLALDCISQFVEESPHSRHSRNERSLHDVVIGARACTKTILASAQCHSNTSSSLRAIENVFSLLPFLPSRWSFRGQCACPFDGDATLAGLVSPDGSAYRGSDGFQWPVFVLFSSEVGHCPALKSMSLKELRLEGVRRMFFLREQKSVFEAAALRSSICSLNDLQKLLEKKMLARRARATDSPQDVAAFISNAETAITLYIASIVKKSDIEHTRLADLSFLTLVLLECTYACVYDDAISAESVSKFQFYAVVFAKTWLEKLIKCFKSSSSIDFEEFSTVLYLFLPTITLCVALHQHCPGVNDFLSEFCKFFFDDVLPALVQSLLPTPANQNAPIFDRMSCLNIMDTALLLLWCTQIRRRYSHQLIQGLCALVHDGHNVGATVVLIIHGLRNRLERVSKEMDSLFAMPDGKALNPALFGKQDHAKLKDLSNVPSWLLSNSTLVCHYNESSKVESSLHQSINVFLCFCANFRDIHKSSMERLFVLDASIFLLRYLLSSSENSQKLLRMPEIRASIDSEVAQILLSNISLDSSSDITLMRVLSALFVEQVCEFFDFAQVWQSTLDNLPFSATSDGMLIVPDRLSASHGILGLAAMFSFGIARPSNILTILPLIVQIVQKSQNLLVSQCAKSMIALFASKIHISHSRAFLALFGPEMLKNCISVGCSMRLFPWSIFAISSKDQALAYCSESIVPAIIDCPKDHFGFEGLSHIDTFDIDSSYWSVIIEIILCHAGGSSESSILPLVQKHLNFIHKEFPSFPNTPVLVYLKASQAADKSSATFVIRVLELLVQRTQWLPSLDSVSWKHLQSSFEIIVDKCLRHIKQLVTSSSLHCKMIPSSFLDLLDNTSVVRIFLSILLEKVESSSCDHDHVRFSAVILTIVEATVQSIFQSQFKVKLFSRHVSFCLHIVMRLIQFTCNNQNLLSLASNVFFANAKRIVTFPDIFQSVVVDIGVLLLLFSPETHVSLLCHQLVLDCSSSIQSLKKDGIHENFELSKNGAQEEYELSMSGLLGCDLPQFDAFKPFIVLLHSRYGDESLEQSTDRWIGIAQSRSLNGTSIEHHCALQALHLRRLLMVHSVELKHSFFNMQSRLSICVSIMLESASRWGSSNIISEAVGECISLLAITPPASCVCFSPSTNQILDDDTFLESTLNLLLNFWFSWNASTATAAVCDIEDFCFTHRHLVGNLDCFAASFPAGMFSSDARHFRKHTFDDSKDLPSRLAHHIEHIQDENYDYHVKNVVFNLSVALPTSNESIRILLTSCFRTISISALYTDLIAPRVFLHSLASSPLAKSVCCEGFLRQQQVALSNSSDHKTNHRGLCRLMTNVRVHARSCIVQRMGLPVSSKGSSLPFDDDPFGSDPLSAAMIADLAGMRSAAIQLLEPLDASASVRTIDSHWARWNGLCGISDAISLICGADASDQTDDFFYQFSENWSCSLAQFDSQCVSNPTPSPTAVLGIVNSLQHLGGHFAANHILESIDRLSDPSCQRKIDSAYYKNALRCDFLQTHAFKEQNQASLFGLEKQNCFETIMCSALGLLHQKRVTECKVACERAIQLAMSDFADMDVLSVRENQAALAKLQSCFELALFCRRNVADQKDVLAYVSDVCSSSIPIHWDFEAHDLIANVRRGMFSVIARVMHSELSPKLAHFQLVAARTARKHKKFSYAHSALMQASSMVGMDRNLILVERSKLAWAAGERRRAFSIISSVQGASAEYRALRWTIEDRADTFEDVKTRVSTFDSNIENESKVGIISAEKCRKLLSKIRYAFASYADSMYQNLFEFLKSPEFLQQSRIQQALGAEVEKLKHEGRIHQHKRRNIETQVDVQQIVLSTTFSNVHMYFAQALKNYSCVLRIGERSSLSAILRFASLLFSSTLASCDEVSISNLFDGIPEEQFLPIFMQFIARLKDDMPSDGMFASFTGAHTVSPNSQKQSPFFSIFCMPAFLILCPR